MGRQAKVSHVRDFSDSEGENTPCVEQRLLKQMTGIDHQIKEKDLFSAHSPGMSGLKLLWVYSRQPTVVGTYSRTFAFTSRHMREGRREEGRRKRQRPQSSTVLL